jgi:colanic acid biosynthesis glycosyl transferase WcaI
MHILIVTPYYPPDLGPSAPMFAMLAESLVSSGHKVTILAAAPHFPSGQVAQGYRTCLWSWELRNGVRVGRAWVPSGYRSNLTHRLLTFCVYQVLVTLVGLRLKYDVVFITNPAIETGLPFAVLGYLRRKPVIFGVWDVYPEVGVRMGLFRSRAVVSLVGFLEDSCLQRANRIQVLGEGFVADLAHHRISPDQIVVIPPWVDTKLIMPIPRHNSFSHEHSLEDNFVVLYAGNLGLSQGLDTVLEAARRLSDRPEILFMFVGEGSDKGQLVNQAVGLNNVRFLPIQPRERLPELLASADVSLVVLKQGIGSGSLPSKTFSILASGRPVLASVDEDSDIWNVVQASQAGLCIPSEDPAALAQAILLLNDDPAWRAQMGRNGRTWVEKNHSPQAAATLLGNMFQAVLAETKSRVGGDS